MMIMVFFCLFRPFFSNLHHLEFTFHSYHNNDHFSMVTFFVLIIISIIVISIIISDIISTTITPLLTVAGENVFLKQLTIFVSLLFAVLAATCSSRSPYPTFILPSDGLSENYFVSISSRWARSKRDSPWPLTEWLTPCSEHLWLFVWSPSLCVHRCWVYCCRGSGTGLLTAWADAVADQQVRPERVKWSSVVNGPPQG